MAVEKLQYFVNGQFKDSKTDTWYDLHNPSTGEVTGQAPCCTEDEVLEAMRRQRRHIPAGALCPQLNAHRLCTKSVN